jgi:hypothetical protein
LLEAYAGELKIRLPTAVQTAVQRVVQRETRQRTAALEDHSDLAARIDGAATSAGFVDLQLAGFVTRFSPGRRKANRVALSVD